MVQLSRRTHAEKPIIKLGQQDLWNVNVLQEFKFQNVVVTSLLTNLLSKVFYR